VTIWQVHDPHALAAHISGILAAAASAVSTVPSGGAGMVREYPALAVPVLPAGAADDERKETTMSEDEFVAWKYVGELTDEELADWEAWWAEQEARQRDHEEDREQAFAASRGVL
jgi:hypothetical protein